MTSIEDKRAFIEKLLGRTPCDKWQPHIHPILNQWVKACGCPNCYPVQIGPRKFDESLDAMREVEMFLSDVPTEPGSKSDRALYREALCVITLGNGGPIHASAMDRFNSFLKLRMTEEEA